MATLPVVSDFMDRNFITFKPQMQIGQAIQTLLKKNLIGACVLDDDGHLLGILSERDCLKVLLQDTFHKGPKGTVGQYYHQVQMTVPPSMDIVEVAQIFLKQQFRRLAVVEDGKLVGQITRRDILRGMKQFESSFNF